MDEALMLLLIKKDFELITIKEICLKAGVNRSTFYLHYENTSDLLAECLEKINDEFLSTYVKSQQVNVRDDALNKLILINKEYLLPYLLFVKEHQSFFKAVYHQPDVFQTDNTFDKMFRDIFNPVLERFGSKEEDNVYIIEYYIKGITSMIMKWADNGCKEDPLHMENLIENCIRPYIEQKNEKSHKKI